LETIWSRIQHAIIENRDIFELLDKYDAEDTFFYLDPPYVQSTRLSSQRYLEEFEDEIDGWVIDAIKSLGLDTAKAVLNAPREMLIEKADLEEDTVDEVLAILRAEFVE
jgi:site-specific DNA-adenine methylase